ncbi:MAG: hypothetical protein ACLUJG_02520 [Lawsonibacter sp.]
MMWAVLAAALAAVFLLGGLRVGAPGEYTPETAGAWLRIGPAEVPNLSQTGRKKAGSSKRDGAGRALRQEEAPPDLFVQTGPAGAGTPAVPPAAGGGGAVPQKAPDRRAAPAPGGRGPDPADAALRYGQANALLGAIWQPVTRVFHVKDGWARVEVDFERTEPALYGRVSLSLTVGELAALGLSFGVKALSVLLAVRREDRQRTGQKQNAAV